MTDTTGADAQAATAQEHIVTKIENALPGHPPAVNTWTTRGALLRERAMALKALHHADLSRRTMIVTGLISVVAAIAALFVGAPFTPPDDGSTIDTTADVVFAAVFTTVAAAPGIALSLWALRRTRRARDIGLRRRAWEDLADHPDARALPRGEIDPDLREPFDARTDPDADADRYIGDVLVRMQVAPWDDRIIHRSIFAGLLIPVGLALLLGSFMAWQPGMQGFPIAGALIFGSCTLQFVKVTQRSWRATQQWKHACNEHKAWLGARSAGS